MYKFAQLDGRATSIGATDTMYVNGDNLETLVNGYRHLYVDGRNLIAQKIKTSDIPGADGAWIDDITNDVREITVGFALKADTSQKLREVYNKLNGLLRGRVTLGFKDEPEWFYDAIFKEANIPTEQSLSFIGKLKFLCPNPTKHRRPDQSTNGVVYLKYARKVLPRKIIVTPQRELNEMALRCGNKQITIVDTSLKAGQAVVYEWLPERFKISQNSRSLLSYIALRDYPSEFYLTHNAKVTADNAVVNLIEWSDEAL